MYENLNFKEWPFQIVPDEKYASHWAGRVKTKQELEKLRRSILLAPKSSIFILWANFGMGKTHTLLFLKNKCLEGTNIVPLYVIMPKRVTGFLDLYGAIINELPFDFLIQQLNRLGNTAPNGVALHPMFNRCPSVVNALLAMRGNEIERTIIARQWLQGKPGLTASNLHSIGVFGRIKSVEDCLNSLQSLISLMTFNNAKRTLIMIDEYQRIGELRQSVLHEINASIRSLYNCCPTNLEVILSFSFGNKDNVKFLLSDELRVILNPQTINLDVLSIEEGIEFLQDLFYQFRINENGTNKSYPFTESSLKQIVAYINTKKSITPRRLMLYTDYVLKSFLLNSEVPSSGIEYKSIAAYLEDPDLGNLDVEIIE